MKYLLPALILVLLPTIASAQIVSPGGGATPLVGGTCTTPQFVQAIGPGAIPTCATPGGGTGAYPSGAPPQIGGFSASNTSEAETLGGDATLTRSGANAYSLAVTKTNGVGFTALATASIPLTVPNGGTGKTTLATGMPVLGAGTGALTTGTTSGNTTVFVTTTGIQTPGDCVSIDASGNHTDFGSPCGTGSGSGLPVGAVGQFVGYPAAGSVGEAETLGGDATLTRVSAGNYSITVTKTNGTAFTGMATAAIPLSIANGGNGAGTVPSAGQIEVAQSASAFGPVTMSGDATITSAGAITVTKTSGTAFTALATATVPLSIANGGMGNATAPSAGQLEIAQSATAYGPKTLSGDATITSAGAITVTKTNGTSFTALATAAVPLSIANGGNGAGTAPSTGQIEVATSSTAYAPVTMSGAATINSSGVVSLVTPVTLTGTTSSVGFNFAGTPAASTIAAFTCVVPVTIPTNFATPNSVLTCGANPAESDAYTVKVNGASVGTLTISTTCGITRGTATATTCSAGQRMEVDAPATVSGSDIAISVGVTR